MDARQHEVTRVLDALRTGEFANGADELLPLLYDELRMLARRRLANEPPGATLDATGLVHEVWLRLVGDHDPGWNGRRHFFAAAALAMRRILVERARARNAAKRGGEHGRVELTESVLLDDGPPLDLLDLDEALDLLGDRHPRAKEIVLMRHFAGLELPEIANALELSLTTIKDDWAFARAWLRRELSRGGSQA